MNILQLTLALHLAVLATGAPAQSAAASQSEPLLPESALPDYEKQLDHAGFIRGWDRAAALRGEKIYQAVCHSCHGDSNLPGSLPGAMRFASGAFQHGSDPYTIYQTITRGWRQMPPQSQLVPQEKYDVIQYIRETFLARSNRAQYFPLTPSYLAQLPAGSAKGPAPVAREPWREMDYGRFLMGTFEIGDEPRRARAAAQPREKIDAIAPDANLAYKGIAIRLDPGVGGVAAGRAWLVFEHDTMRVAGAWTGQGFIDWEGINFNSRHVVWPRTVGEVQFELGDGPGWANPATGRFADERLTGLDGRRFGPFPRTWMRFRGLYRHDERIVLSYTVGDAAVLESHDLAAAGETPVFVRTLNIGQSSRDLTLRVAREGGAAVALASSSGAALVNADGFVTVTVPGAATPLTLALWLARPGTPVEKLAQGATPRDLAPATRGGAAAWAGDLVTPIVRSSLDGAFAWDRISLPTGDSWKTRLRVSGVDFLPGGDQAVVCCWDGDIWRVDGIAGETETRWRRIASGLFQPLGIKVREGDIFVTCRDQLVRLRDLNGDGETDFYECFNSDHQVTEHFHEFAMGLQADTGGNFFYAKSARHARPPLVPQHGTLLKISADGAGTEILANGFRAANGVTLNPDGSFFVTDQEGHWMPMNRINRVLPGRFYGNMWSYGAPADSSDAAMEPPLCWIAKGFDNSPAELVWVENKAWGRLDGALLNLSYGRGRLEVVVSDPGQLQGAVCVLPTPDFPTGIMRGRFHPQTGDLYLCGLSAWGSRQTQQEGGFYRLRPTGNASYLPVAWRVHPDVIEITFTELGNVAAAGDAARYAVNTWTVERSAAYGGPHTQQRVLSVKEARVLTDGRTVRLTIPGLAVTRGIEIACRLQGADGHEVERVLAGTIQHLSVAGSEPTRAP
ncbi:MAG: hypothetical protein RIQ93_1207 [Verrucomicrobiota bacterium]|jgi:mono/diheme cytochrome c family protein